MLCFFKMLKFWFFCSLFFHFLSSSSSLSDTPECHPLTQTVIHFSCFLLFHFLFFPLLFLQKLHHFGVSTVHSHSHRVFYFNSVFMLSARSPLFFSFHLSSYILFPYRPSRLPWLFPPTVTVRQSESLFAKRLSVGVKNIVKFFFFLSVSCETLTSLLYCSIIDVLHGAECPRFDQQSWSFFMRM